jgi:hypothetical protein
MTTTQTPETTKYNVVSTTPVPGGVSLVSNDRVSDISASLITDYNEMLTDLASASVAGLRARVRAYDNMQRLTLGRAQTALLPLANIRTSITWESFHRLSVNGPDKSFFPKRLTRRRYQGVLDAIAYSLENLVEGSAYDKDSVLVTVFCHRVLVRPGEQYLGFLHRDLPVPGRIGTAVWYPRVDSKLIEGAQLFGFESDSHPLKYYDSLEPDYVFDPSVYDGRVLMMSYPRNFVHGVRGGVNNAPRAISRELHVADFLHPTDNCFIKDLTIITVSSESPVEE